MIKFWKSAAKGKSGCPVRPPELNTVNSVDFKTLVDNQSKLNDEDHQKHIYRKKSKLSLSLHDILVKKNAINCLIQYMETIDKHLLIQCWLELEHFTTVIKSNTSSDVDNNFKVVNAESLCNSTKNNEGNDLSQTDCRSSKTDCRSSSKFASTCNKKFKYELPISNSCGNLTECTQPTENCIDVTETAINLFKKYIALEAPNKLELPDDVRKLIISNICQPEGKIKEDCFQPVLDTLFNQINDKYFNDFQNSQFYIKAQIDILTNESLDLEDILYNETILFYFTEYLEQESSRVLLEFLMAIIHFKDSLMCNKSINPEQAQADAIILYEKYFSLQASSPIGFPTDIRLTVESDICREEGPLPTCFDFPYKIIFRTLSCYMKTFLESDVYYKYLSEMLHSVNNTSPNHKAYSDCSSEFSISTQNTLLAMGDPIFNRKKRNHSVPDMTIDSNQLYNADALWQRKRHDSLILGRINSLGRFESKFEPDPDKKQKSVLKKMVSRFVPTNPAKVEEEMAWQIAHMIVKDVTDLTMAPPENDRDNTL